VERLKGSTNGVVGAAGKGVLRAWCPGLQRLMAAKRRLSLTLLSTIPPQTKWQKRKSESLNAEGENGGHRKSCTGTSCLRRRMRPCTLDKEARPQIIFKRWRHRDRTLAQGIEMARRQVRRSGGKEYHTRSSMPSSKRCSGSPQQGGDPLPVGDGSV